MPGPKPFPVDRRVRPVTTAVPPPVREALQAEADASGKTLSRLIHDILTEHVRRRPNK